jgi:hypothetical protein
MTKAMVTAIVVAVDAVWRVEMLLERHVDSLWLCFVKVRRNQRGLDRKICEKVFLGGA